MEFADAERTIPSTGKEIHLLPGSDVHLSLIRVKLICVSPVYRLFSHGADNITCRHSICSVVWSHKYSRISRCSTYLCTASSSSSFSSSFSLSFFISSCSSRLSSAPPHLLPHLPHTLPHHFTGIWELICFAPLSPQSPVAWCPFPSRLSAPYLHSLKSIDAHSYSCPSHTCNNSNIPFLIFTVLFYTMNWTKDKQVIFEKNSNDNLTAFMRPMNTTPNGQGYTWSAGWG